jgi:hypothetical protein
MKTRPTEQNPLLIGILVDVSASMLSSIQNNKGVNSTRLESFRDAFDDLIEKGRELSSNSESQNILPMFRIFAYGFGFGNPLSFFLGGSKENVRDLLNQTNHSEAAISIVDLAENWISYRSNIVRMSKEMFGNTPMYKALKVAKERIKYELKTLNYSVPAILFLLSDGEPTDSSKEEIREITNWIKDNNTLLISCFITDKDITEPKRLYNNKQLNWPDGANLMFECASVIPSDSPFYLYFKEYKWIIEENAKFFTQINQSDILKEFLNVIISPIENHKSSSLNQTNRITKIFVSYSHVDKKYLEKNSLFGFLKGLEKENIEFWYDKRIETGDFWDETIKDEIISSDIVIVLVSQAFLNSRYCIDVEIVEFLNQRKSKGLCIYPIILSACDWKSHNWLSSIQFQPKDGRNIESHFKDKGKQKELYLEILEEIRLAAKKIK